MLVYKKGCGYKFLPFDKGKLLIGKACHFVIKTISAIVCKVVNLYRIFDYKTIVFRRM